MKKDIAHRDDIHLLVSKFYQQLMEDEMIGFIFTDHMSLSLEEHLPIIVDFWQSVLLDQPVYKGNPMLAHIELSKRVRLKDEFFDRWLALWDSTINLLFNGEKAELAKSKAKPIAELMKYKIKQSTNSGFIQ